MVFAPRLSIRHLSLLALLLIPSLTQAAPSVDQMFANFSASSISLIKMLVAASFLMGIGITIKGVLSLKEYSESGGRTSFSTPLIFLIVGAFLVSLPGTINTATETMSLGANSGVSVFSDASGGGVVPGMSAAVKGILLFVKLVGHIAVIRGLLILKKGGEAGQHVEMGRVLTHILGGAAAINITTTAHILAATVGIVLPI